MNKTLFLSSVIVSTAIISQPTFAARSTAQQAAVEAGTFAGVTLAATVAAGPVGLAVGSIAAAFLAKQTKKSNDYELKLSEVTTQQERLTTLVMDQTMELRALEESVLEKLSFQVLFATGEDTLNEVDLHRVIMLAEYLKKNPDLNVTIDGHTDPRGTDGYNNILSQERAKAVKRALTDLGIHQKRIVSKGHGAKFSTAAKGDLSAYYQERRVDIEMHSATGEQTVADSD